MTDKYFESHFYERSPGSVGVATMSALAATFLIWICGLVKLGYAHAPETDLVVVLLAFPAAIGAWAGFGETQDLFGGTLVARLSLLLTVGLSFLAAGGYVFQPSYDGSAAYLARPYANYWTVIGGISFLNLVAAVGSWFLRSSVQRHFATRRR